MQTTLFDAEGTITVPDQVAVEGKISGNEVRCLARLHQKLDCRVTPFQQRNLSGYVATPKEGEPFLVLAKKSAASTPFTSSIVVENAASAADILDGNRKGKMSWQRPGPVSPAKEERANAEARCAIIVNSWVDQFSFVQEDRNDRTKGLRQPQIGALYATLAHWSTSDAPATIVMPTGTGKTETMLALLVCARLPRLMVVVPNTALRDQIFEKFVTLGKLAECGCVPDTVRLPAVLKLEHRPSTPEEVDDLFSRANVIVANMQVAGQCAPKVHERMADLCSHLFIDEAHHIAAKTWSEFKRAFAAKPIVQFTATPFRTDGKRVDGKFIYSYPLTRAQDEGYFRPVSLLPVEEFDPDQADGAIARRAGRQLSEDLTAGFDHLLMARAESTKRAEIILGIYQKHFPHLKPVLIHSKMEKGERSARLQALKDRESRILVCVDMFGEGFDFPQLKIAALHDQHKSLAITLQFIGRFTRDTPENVSNAHVVANIVDEAIADGLRNLYAEDADWNFLLKMFSEAATDKARKRQEILEGFTASLDGIPLQTLFPRMSAVVYRTNCKQWTPLRVEDVLGATLHTGPVLNPAQNLAVYITRDAEEVKWGSVRQLQNVTWNLHVLHWDEEQKLLFINSSSKDFHERVAKEVGGTDQRLAGQDVFRALGGIKRLVLTNLGLSHAFGKNIRYTKFMGADIAEGLTETQKLNRKMSDVFGLGYEADEKTTVGCSFKGRLWSYQKAYDLSEWIDWCRQVGAKLLDPQINMDAILGNLIKARKITERPPLVPIMIMWPEGFDDQPEEAVTIQLGGVETTLIESEIVPSEYSDTGPLRFLVSTEAGGAEFEINLSDDTAIYAQVAGPPAQVTVRGKTRPMAEAFALDPPIVHFANGDFLVMNELFEIPKGAARIAFKEIETWDWTKVNLKRESQGQGKFADSIQRRVLDEALGGYFGPSDIVFDGDGNGEVADVVTLHRDGAKLTANLIHCKFSASEKAGARIGDMYEVCGQAQKCVHWREEPKKMLQHLLSQEKRRTAKGQNSRFEKGQRRDLQILINEARTLTFDYRIWLVQPGVDITRLSPAFTDVLGATEAFLRETYSMPLTAILNSVPLEE